jgi:hypothetical protein
VLAVIRALFLALVFTAGCTPEECNDLTRSGPLGAFLVGGGGPAEAYRICETLPTPAPIQPAALLADGTCAPASGDDACLSCVKTSCCEAAAACVGEAVCSCLVACRTADLPLATCADAAQCGATDRAYDTAVACVAKHCAEQCPRLQ